MINDKNIEPVGARTLVRIIEGDVESKSGLALSNNNNMELPVMGEVLESGVDSVFKKGETLLFRRYGVDELTFNIEGDQVKVYLVEDVDVVARVKVALVQPKAE